MNALGAGAPTAESVLNASERRNSEEMEVASKVSSTLKQGREL